VSKRKPFKWVGRIVMDKKAKTLTWTPKITLDADTDYEVRERLPACKHEGKTVLATGVLWCSDCGAARKFGDTRWRKPRRA
jgi:hypothetical protein